MAKIRLVDFQSGRPVLPGDIRKNFDDMVRILKESFLSMARTSAMILLILMAAFTLQFEFAAVRISVDLAEWIAAFDRTRFRQVSYARSLLPRRNRDVPLGAGKRPSTVPGLARPRIQTRRFRFLHAT